jgi:hypothetical protein
VETKKSRPERIVIIRRRGAGGRESGKSRRREDGYD